MKLFAARVEIDADDVTLLYRQLGFTTVNEGLDLVGHAHTGRPIPAKVRFLLTEIVDSTHGRNAGMLRGLPGRLARRRLRVRPLQLGFRNPRRTGM
jgi:hypothetical protein